MLMTLTHMTLITFF